MQSSSLENCDGASFAADVWLCKAELIYRRTVIVYFACLSAVIPHCIRILNLHYWGLVAWAGMNVLKGYVLHIMQDEEHAVTSYLCLIAEDQNWHMMMICKFSVISGLSGHGCTACTFS
jgi:hypothetical protein